MLMATVESYLNVRRAAGFELRSPSYLLRDYAKFASKAGDTHVRTATAIAWATRAPSLQQRDRRLRYVILLARHARAEDDLHEVPPSHIFAAPPTRPMPYLFTSDELGRILAEARRLGPEGSLRPQTYRTLFGLLAACGLRVSEALDLQLDDIRDDGLVIRETKFRKSRLVPMHPTTEGEVQQYLRLRQRFPVARGSTLLFVSMRGGRIGHSTVTEVFHAILRHLGLRGAPGEKGPRLHDIRHAFAARALETCPHDDVANHMLALSTYLGHANIADTYWYLRVTPVLRSTIADACQIYLNGPQP